MTDEQRVDPRYDPAFQRGYAGPASSRARPARRSDRAAASSVERPATEPPPDPQPAADDTPLVEHPPASPADAEPEQLARLAPLRDLTRNPFLVAVAVLGLVLAIGGVAWGNQGRQLVATRGGAATELDYWFLQATVVGAPLTAVAGIAIIAGVLFVAAAAWNRRPR